MTNMHQYESKIAEFGVALKKKKRAATEHVASIALPDLAKYFDLPIVEASKNLKVGLTVLKRKCREFGIPRWPHRKIKSLDTLIHNLQMWGASLCFEAQEAGLKRDFETFKCLASRQSGS